MASLLLGSSTAAWAGEVARWVQAIESGLSLNADPFATSRHAAMAYLAISDALNAIDRRFEPYALDTSAPTASPAAATAAAAHTVLTTALQEYAPLAALVPLAAIQAIYDGAYAAALATVPDGPAKTAGIALGQSAAQAVLATRAGDNVVGALLFPYVPGNQPGDYQLVTVPGIPFGVIFAGYTALLKPFVLDSPSQFRPPAPPALTSIRYAIDALEVRAFGRSDSILRTAEQSEIAHFWFENSVTGWSRIGRQLAAARGLDEWTQARLFALLNVSIADGVLAHFDAKYFYELWRPITALTAANTGNVLVPSDPTWTAFCVTPPTPEYASGHSLNGGAAAAVLEEFFGRNTSFTATSLTEPGATRQFNSFRDAAAENAVSRIYCGIHFRNSTERGLLLGRQIARFVLNEVLRPDCDDD